MGFWNLLKEIGLVPIEFTVDHVEGSAKFFLRNVLMSVATFALCFGLAVWIGWRWTLLVHFFLQIAFTCVASYNLARIYVVTIPHLELWQAGLNIFQGGISHGITDAQKTVRKTIMKIEPFLRGIVLFQWFMLAIDLLLSVLDLQEAPASALLMIAGALLLAMAWASGAVWKHKFSSGRNVLFIILAIVFWLIAGWVGWTDMPFLAWTLGQALPWILVIGFLAFWTFQHAGILITVSSLIIVIGLGGVVAPQHFGLHWDEMQNVGHVELPELPVRYRTFMWTRESDGTFALIVDEPYQSGGRTVQDTARVEVGQILRFASTKLVPDGKKNMFREVLGIVDPVTLVVDPLSKRFWVLDKHIEYPERDDQTFSESRRDQVSHIALGLYPDRYEGYDPEFMERMKRFGGYDPYAELQFNTPTMQLTHPLGAGNWTVTSPYGKYRAYLGGKHKGVDWYAPVGTPVYAAHEGRVIDMRGPVPNKDSYVLIEYPTPIRGAVTLRTRYLHLSRTLVRVGEWVEAGQPIGTSGGQPGTAGSNFTTGPHLHFEVLEGRVPVEPRIWTEVPEKIQVQGKDFAAFALHPTSVGPNGGVIVELPPDQLVSKFQFAIRADDIIEVREIAPLNSELVLTEDSDSPVYGHPVSSEGIRYPAGYKDTFFFPLESARYGATLIGVDGLDAQLGKGTTYTAKTAGWLYLCPANEEIGFKHSRTLIGDPTLNNNGPYYKYEIVIKRSGATLDLSSLII